MHMPEKRTGSSIGYAPVCAELGTQPGQLALQEPEAEPALRELEPVEAPVLDEAAEQVVGKAGPPERRHRARARHVWTPRRRRRSTCGIRAKGATTRASTRPGPCGRSRWCGERRASRRSSSTRSAARARWMSWSW